MALKQGTIQGHIYRDWFRWGPIGAFRDNLEVQMNALKAIIRAHGGHLSEAQERDWQLLQHYDSRETTRDQKYESYTVEAKKNHQQFLAHYVNASQSPQTGKFASSLGHALLGLLLQPFSYALHLRRIHKAYVEIYKYDDNNLFNFNNPAADNEEAQQAGGNPPPGPQAPPQPQAGPQPQPQPGPQPNPQPQPAPVPQPAAANNAQAPVAAVQGNQTLALARNALTAAGMILARPFVVAWSAMTQGANNLLARYSASATASTAQTQPANPQRPPVVARANRQPAAAAPAAIWTAVQHRAKKPTTATDLERASIDPIWNQVPQAEEKRRLKEQEKGSEQAGNGTGRTQDGRPSVLRRQRHTGFHHRHG